MRIGADCWRRNAGKTGAAGILAGALAAWFPTIVRPAVPDPPTPGVTGGNTAGPGQRQAGAWRPRMGLDSTFSLLLYLSREDMVIDAKKGRRTYA